MRGQSCSLKGLHQKLQSYFKPSWDGEISQANRPPFSCDPVPLEVASSKPTWLKSALTFLQMTNGRNPLEGPSPLYDVSYLTASEVSSLHSIPTTATSQYTTLLGREYFMAVCKILEPPFGIQPLLIQDMVDLISCNFRIAHTNCVGKLHYISTFFPLLTGIHSFIYPTEGIIYLFSHTTSNPLRFTLKFVLLSPEDTSDYSVFWRGVFPCPLNPPSSISFVLHEGKTLFVPAGWKIRWEPVRPIPFPNQSSHGLHGACGVFDANRVSI